MLFPLILYNIIPVWIIEVGHLTFATQKCSVFEHNETFGYMTALSTSSEEKHFLSVIVSMARWLHCCATNSQTQGSNPTNSILFIILVFLLSFPFLLNFLLSPVSILFPLFSFFIFSLFVYFKNLEFLYLDRDLYLSYFLVYMKHMKCYSYLAI